MYDERIKRLLASRARAIETAREHLERAESEGRSLEGEVKDTYDAAMADVRRLDGELKETRELRDAEADADRQREEFAHLLGNDGGRGQSDAEAEFRQFLAGEAGRDLKIPFDSRTLQTPAVPGGPNNGEEAVVPETFVARLYEALRETSIVRQLATQITTASGEKLTFPRQTGRAKASRVAESATIPKSDPEFDKTHLESHKYGFIGMISSEFATDSAINIIPLLVAQGREALFEAQAEDWMVGDGDDAPVGIFPGATQVLEAAAPDAVSFEELLALKYALRPAYRRGALYVIADSTVPALASVRNEDGQYAWKVSDRDGEPDRIHGKPLEVDPYAPELEAEARSVAFLNPAHAYLIRDVGEVRVTRSDEYAFDTDEIAWRFLVRSDGGVWDDNALAVLKQAEENGEG